jgi:thioredoxin
MGEDVKKVCPRCRREDFTTFSKCRFCETPYLAVLEAKKSTLDLKGILILVSLAGLLFGGYYCKTIEVQERNKRLESVIAEIKAVGRPRVVEFYADWCGPCRAYAPILEAMQGTYGGRIDFYRLNVDEQKNADLVARFGVSSIPRTCIFDGNGKQVLDKTGVVPQAVLQETLAQVLR